MTLQGFVYKEGGTILNWKRRFLVLEKDRLAYYVRENKKDKKGEILFSNIKGFRRHCGYKGRNFVFNVATISGRTYYIQCNDETIVTHWIDALTQVTGIRSRGSCTIVGSIQPRPRIPTQTKDYHVDDFECVCVIGRGGFSRVLLVKKKDNGKVYAMKVLNKSQIVSRGEAQHVRAEQSVLSKIDNPFLVKLQFSFQDKENLYLITDFINGGEICYHLSKKKQFSEILAKFYSSQIVLGLEYLHSHGIIYRDLKPENLLLKPNGYLVMTDFGLVKEFLASDSRTNTFCGTPEYLAPEVLRGEGYTMAIDWWCLGAVIYEMLTGCPPFFDEDEEVMYHNIVSIPLVIPTFFTDAACDIVVRLLSRDPNNRLQDPEQIKAHRWFVDTNWSKLMRQEIPAPFTPTVWGVDDLQNIDREFLNEDTNLSSCSENFEDENDFFGFTFVRK
eukprot:TRINITY_DN16582_c0_g1_i1.p1 TRINITY_DN16582_c0_g1~~TRINITY_DN16582_c0_g1_i1.p1  ORF type:complete len:444 (+),score=87.32 TRINITY_DN16582_c0_g1_i1:1100-2431(+)